MITEERLSWLLGRSGTSVFRCIKVNGDSYMVHRSEEMVLMAPCKFKLGTYDRYMNCVNPHYSPFSERMQNIIEGTLSELREPIPNPANIIRSACDDSAPSHITIHPIDGSIGPSGKKEKSITIATKLIQLVASRHDVTRINVRSALDMLGITNSIGCMAFIPAVSSGEVVTNRKPFRLTFVEDVT